LLTNTRTMKFCKNVQRIVDISDPEWAPYWINYKMLKKLIKELPSLVPVDDGVIGDNTNNPSKLGMRTSGTVASQTTARLTGGLAKASTQQQESGDKTKSEASSTSASSKASNGARVVHDMGRSPGEIAFFKLIRAEFKKASQFFERAQQEYEIREQRIKEGMEIITKPNSIMVNDKWACMAKSVYRLYKDLLLLETYAIMSYCSFSKILKKHDKVTGYKTRTAFMSNVVNNANFTNYPKLSAMIRNCETLYDEVARNLRHEGSPDLCEDERLFINMIHRLNMQIMDKAEQEGAPDLSQRRTNSIGVTGGISSQSSSHVVNKAKTDCKATSTLRTLVEENEAKTEGSGSACLSDDPDDAVTAEGKSTPSSGEKHSVEAITIPEQVHKRQKLNG
jgi:hypothetical protein